MQFRAKLSIGKVTLEPSGRGSFWSARLTVTVAAGSFSRAAKSALCVSGETIIGRNEFFSELPRKMSAKEVLITARKPYCVSAQGACSRELPQPKLSPARSNWDFLAASVFKIKSALGDPSAL